MKETPAEKKIRKNMQKGVLSIAGFLGNDERHIHEIIDADKISLKILDLTKEEIADRLEYFTEKAFESYIGPTIIDEKYEVFYNSFRGKILCPFAHPGAFRKGLITLKNLENNLEISWTPLNIHMIREHTFFEGEGSKHRLDPKILKEVIF